MENKIYDKVIVNQPIPNKKFSLPHGIVKIAKTIEQYREIVQSARLAKLSQTRQAPAFRLAEKRLSDLPWTGGLPAALAKAGAEKKIVLLDFTGSDWCVDCMKFDDDILSKPEFADYARSHLVMVKVDFPQVKFQSKTAKKTNRTLLNKFKVKSFPTCVVLSPDGREIGRQVGCLLGGPKAFISELEKFKRR